MSVAIDAQIGDVTTGGQVAVGSHILQVGSVAGDLVFRTEQKFAPPRLREQPVRVLPKRFAGMLDRQTETETVVRLIQSNESLECNGEPGSGKTSLLRHLAHLPHTEIFQSGVIYFQVNGLPAADLAQSLFEAFYEYESPTKPTEMELRRSLQQIKGLVLLDDAEMTREQIEQLMNLAPNSVFITASSKRTLAGEAEAISLKGLPAAEAVTLFQREFGRALSDEELIATSRLCETLKWHPRSILRAATTAREDNRSLIEAIAQEVNATPSEATTAQLDKASENEKRVLTALAVFYGAPVQVEHVAAVAGLIDVDKEIESLERKGLVESHDERYNLPSDVNVALLGNLTDSFARALIHFTDWTELHRADHKAIAKAALPILLVLKWGLAAKCWPEVIRLAHAAEEALTFSGHWEMWAATLESALQAARAQSNRAEEAWALHQLGTRALCLDEKATAKANLREALSIREGLGDTVGAAATRHNLDLLLLPTPTKSKTDDNGGAGGGRGAGAGGTAIPLMLRIGAPVLLALLGGAAAWRFFSTPPIVSASIVSFSGSPTSVASNGQVQICYEVRDASTVSISPGVGELKSQKECIPITPLQTTTYTLTATGEDKKTTSRDLTIIVEQPRVLAEIFRFEVVRADGSVNPNGVQDQLCYGVRIAVKVEIDNGIGDVTLTPQRCLPIKPAQETTYTLTATDVQGQIATRQATANPTEQAPLPPQILSFDPSDRSIERDKVVSLCYELVDVTSARIEPAVGEVKVGPGRQCVPAAPKDNIEYVLTAVNAAGNSVNKKASVVVIQPPARIVSFKSNPEKVLEEGPVELCYSVQNAKSVRIDGRAVTRDCTTTTIHETTTFTLSATGLDGSVTNESLTVPVERRPINIVEFSANPQTIERGKKSEICYQVQLATSISIDPRLRSGSISSERECVTAAPTETTTFTLTASARHRPTVSRQVTVTVKERERRHARIVDFTVSSQKITAGQTVKLCYEVVDAEVVSLSPLSRSLPKLDKNCLDHAPKSKTIYTLTAIGEDGRPESREQTVEVEAEPVVSPLKITRFELKKRRLGGMQVCYGVENAKSAWIDPDFNEVTLPGKCLDIRAHEPRTYTLTATGHDGRTEKRSVEYTPQPTTPVEPIKFPLTIVSLRANPKTIKPGGQAQLCYITIGEGTAHISPAPGVVTSTSTCVTVAPKETTTYVMTVTGPQGQQSSKSVTVTVQQAPGPIIN